MDKTTVRICSPAMKMKLFLLSLLYILPFTLAARYAAPMSAKSFPQRSSSYRTTSAPYRTNPTKDFLTWQDILRGGGAAPSLPLLEGILQLTLNNGVAQGAQERRQHYKELPPQQVLGLLLLPNRLLRLGVIALAFAEILHRLGIIQSDPDQLQAKFQEYWKDSGKPWTEKVFRRWKTSWDEACQPGGLLHAKTWRNFDSIMSALSKLPNHYQFAVGGAVGLVASPLLWAVGVSVLRVATITYLVSEANFYAVTHEDEINAALKNTNASFRPAFSSQRSSSRYHDRLLLPPQIHGVLERVRVAVRNLIKSPKAVLLAMWDELDERLPQHWEFPPFVSRGLVIGTVAGLILVL